MGSTTAWDAWITVFKLFGWLTAFLLLFIAAIKEKRAEDKRSRTIGRSQQKGGMQALLKAALDVLKALFGGNGACLLTWALPYPAWRLPGRLRLFGGGEISSWPSSNSPSRDSWLRLKTCMVTR